MNKLFLISFYSFSTFIFFSGFAVIYKNLLLYTACFVIYFHIKATTKVDFTKRMRERECKREGEEPIPVFATANLSNNDKY